jgi:hypothetical protein
MNQAAVTLITMRSVAGDTTVQRLLDAPPKSKQDLDVICIPQSSGKPLETLRSGVGRKPGTWVAKATGCICRVAI